MTKFYRGHKQDRRLTGKHYLTFFSYLPSLPFPSLPHRHNSTRNQRRGGFAGTGDFGSDGEFFDASAARERDSDPRRRRPPQVLLHVQNLPSTAGFSLRDVRQLRGRIRSSLPVGRQLHRKAELPILLLFPLLPRLFVRVHLLVRRRETRDVVSGVGRRRSHERLASDLPRTVHLLLLHLVRVGPLRLSQLLDSHEPDDQRGSQKVLLIASMRQKPALEILGSQELRRRALRTKVSESPQGEGGGDWRDDVDRAERTASVLMFWFL